jgi:hypothetical protein
LDLLESGSGFDQFTLQEIDSRLEDGRHSLGSLGVNGKGYRRPQIGHSPVEIIYSRRKGKIRKVGERIG